MKTLVSVLHIISASLAVAFGAFAIVMAAPFMFLAAGFLRLADDLSGKQPTDDRVRTPLWTWARNIRQAS